MTKSIDKIISEFEESSQHLFTHLSIHFKNAASALDREKDENVFQRLGSQYTVAFKEQLTQLALKLLENNKAIVNNPDHLQRSISQRLDAYVNEFRQQSKQL